MKKIISIISIVLLAGAVAVLTILLAKSSNVESIEIAGEIQTIYFVNSTNEVNFNDAELKITYKDGTVKMKKLTSDLVDVNFFSTTVQNNGIMKISYKSKDIDVSYSVISKGLYYLSEKNTQTFNGNEITETNSGNLVAGVNNKGEDYTTSDEMIYFGDDGICDYYYKAEIDGENNWIMINGNNNADYYYKITGNKINVHLGEQRVLNLSAIYSKYGSLSLTCVENEYANGSSDFVKSKTSMSFSYYEMKNNRTFTSDDVSIYSTSDIIFAKNSKFADASFDLYLIVTYKNDYFLRTVYVKFSESMFNTENEFNTNSVGQRMARCHFNGVHFEFSYNVY